LQVRECQEIVALGISPEELKSTAGGQHLSPEEFHTFLPRKPRASQSENSSENNPENKNKSAKFSVDSPDLIRGECPPGLGPGSRPILIDCRNEYEWKVGKFEDAILPPTRQFSEFPKFADELIEKYKLRVSSSDTEAPTAVMMYCTGGIRCERGSAYLRSKGVQNVYQLEGGIHRYLEKYPKGGKYRGKLFVFDKRRIIQTDTAEVVGRCELCSRPHDTYNDKVRCSLCRALALVCDTCRISKQAEKSEDSKLVDQSSIQKKSREDSKISPQKTTTAIMTNESSSSQSDKLTPFSFVCRHCMASR